MKYYDTPRNLNDYVESWSLINYKSWHCWCPLTFTLQWCHNEHDGISNHQPHDCLLNRLFRHRSKKTSKLHVTGLCVRNSPVTGEFPAQRASNAENVIIWWRHHGEEKILKISSSLCLLIVWLQLVIGYLQVPWLNSGNRCKCGLTRDHFVYAPSQWEMTSQCNVTSHLLLKYIHLCKLIWEPNDSCYFVRLIK